MKKSILLITIGCILLYSCSTSGTDGPTTPGLTDDTPIASNTWSIPVGEVLDGGPGKDGIPALVNPTLISVGEASFMEDDDLVLAFKNGEDVRAYPHPYSGLA